MTLFAGLIVMFALGWWARGRFERLHPPQSGEVSK